MGTYLVRTTKVNSATVFPSLLALWFVRSFANRWFWDHLSLSPFYQDAAAASIAFPNIPLPFRGDPKHIQGIGNKGVVSHDASYFDQDAIVAPRGCLGSFVRLVGDGAGVQQLGRKGNQSLFSVAFEQGKEVVPDGSEGKLVVAGNAVDDVSADPGPEGLPGVDGKLGRRSVFGAGQQNHQLGLSKRKGGIVTTGPAQSGGRFGDFRNRQPGAKGSAQSRPGSRFEYVIVDFLLFRVHVLSIGTVVSSARLVGRFGAHRPCCC
mmetsp:Transcript_17947/g.41186  ORF Transcript_17947/g.41186 Transcript_17947/m.41186 type:complete len:263 (+) Transcript_17947:633-1421(+)